METNKKDKLKLISWVIPIILIIPYIVYKATSVIIVLEFFTGWSIFNSFDIITFLQMLVSLIIPFIMLMSILQMYTYWILKSFSKKKIVKGILLTLLPVVAVLGIIFIKNNMNVIFKNLIFRLAFILAIICIPIIVLGKIILQDGKRKTIKIIMVIVFSVLIYFNNFSTVLDYARTIVTYIKSYPIYEIVSLKKDEKLDTSYLQKYTQKFARNGYLDKFDIKQILDIADSKSAIININYKDEMKKINVNILNKNDEKMVELKEMLEAEYYKFNYEINEKNEVVINVERYTIAKKEIKEKNSEIILSGEKRNDIITNTYKSASEKDGYLVYDNKINLENTNSGKQIEELKLLFVYDKEKDNYIPVIKKDEEYNYKNIYFYKIYQDGIEIILKDEITLNKKDYTLRINRYDDNLNITDQNTNNNYYYEYEPVVTEATTITDKDDKISNIVLEIKFNGSYTVNNLKNIEIIF